MGERKNGGGVVGEEEEGMVGRVVEGDEEGKVRWGEEEDAETTPLPVSQTSRQTVSGDSQWGEN